MEFNSENSHFGPWHTWMQFHTFISAVKSVMFWMVQALSEHSLSLAPWMYYIFLYLNNSSQVNNDSGILFLFSRLSFFFLVGSFRWVYQTQKYWTAGISLEQWIIKQSFENSYLKNSARKLLLRSPTIQQ